MTGAAVLERFDVDGYVVFRDVLDRATVANLNDHVDWLLSRHPDRRPEDLTHDLARSDPFWTRLVGDDRLLDIAELFLGADIALFATHYICKPPRTGRRVHWHQDGAFWPLDPMRVVSLWLAVTESTPRNGCLRVIPGSHRSDLAAMRPRDTDAVFAEEMSVAVDEAAAVDIRLDAGDVSVHHPNIHHASEPNRSDRWRRGLTVRYIPTTTRITDPDAAVPILLRGNPVVGVNEYLPAVDWHSDSFRPAAASEQ